MKQGSLIQTPFTKLCAAVFFIVISTRAMAVEYPLSVEHRFGVSVINQQPTRVATVDWGGADNLLALGYQPLTVRYWFGDYTNGIWPWAQPLLSSEPEVIRGELNFEQIARTHPDLILAIRSGISKEDYKQLSKIAPVIAVPTGEGDYTLNWEQRARLVAHVLNREEEAEARIAKIKARFAEVRKTHPGWTDKTLAMATYWDGNIGVYSADDVTVRLKSEMGLSVAPGIRELTREGEFFMTISEEMLSILDADILFWYVSEGAKEKVESLVLRPHMRAYKEGREVFMPTSSQTNGALSHGSLLSIPVAIDLVEPLIETAIDGDPNTPVPEVH